ncbi:hypothetical protein K501DRAFT_254804 [Backusella circina FSU 941]|nr:hypothetical protein K501DRAFT_254804 [Backusella circina FSU 941]
MDSALKRTRSVSPVMENTDDSLSSNSPSAVNRVTRSHSVEVFEAMDTNINMNNKKRKLKPSLESINNRKTYSRHHRHKKEAEKTSRDIDRKKRLDELDQVEKAIKDGSHAEYHRLLNEVENKRAKMLHIIQARRASAQSSITRFFTSQKDIAYSQYFWDKLALRHSMIQHVQQQINNLEHEYYSNHISSNSLDENQLMDWSPPDRPTMISSLTLGLSEEVSESDVQLAKQNPFTLRESSPPLDMLASLADHQYQKDFELQTTLATNYQS